jgi:hypothetical protein
MAWHARFDISIGTSGDNDDGTRRRRRSTCRKFDTVIFTVAKQREG